MIILPGRSSMVVMCERSSQRFLDRPRSAEKLDTQAIAMVGSQALAWNINLGLRTRLKWFGAAMVKRFLDTTAEGTNMSGIDDADLTVSRIFR